MMARGTWACGFVLILAACESAEVPAVRFEAEAQAEELGYASTTCFSATRSYWNAERFDGPSACLIARRYSDVVNGFTDDDGEQDTYFVITGPLARDLDGTARSILVVRTGGTRRETTLELTLDATNHTLLSAAEVPEGL